MTKYHINPETGRANQCNAKIKCRFGDVEHYSTKEEARTAYERSKAGETFNTIKKKAIPPVSTDKELEREHSELREELYGTSLKEVLEYRGVNRREIEKLESEGEYTVYFKVPSYYETGCSTDLARKALGLPKRNESSSA
jgi:hypothetical protein